METMATRKVVTELAVKAKAMSMRRPPPDATSYGASKRPKKRPWPWH